jgi:hypothetical protein
MAALAAATLGLLARLRLDISEGKATDHPTQQTAQRPPPIRFGDEGLGDRIEPRGIHDEVLHAS